ncbi:hypothetical protein NDU88_005699 [Pleurodeles waltl]|uniref:Uncharacterized protein n=1 Tax=Pleurodeles waltl TaxID=8319 RepID=A0AAV7RLR9_PLEWA|nr:hypothetical protein NDU88_005699 [Pleurodeles waltl]
METFLHSAQHRRGHHNAMAPHTTQYDVIGAIRSPRWRADVQVTYLRRQTESGEFLFEQYPCALVGGVGRFRRHRWCRSRCDDVGSSTQTPRQRSDVSFFSRLSTPKCRATKNTEIGAPELRP